MTSTSSSCLQRSSTPVSPSAPILTQVRVIDVTHSTDLPCCCVNILFGPVPHLQHDGSHIWLGMCLESAECVCCQSEGGCTSPLDVVGQLEGSSGPCDGETRCKYSRSAASWWSPSGLCEEHRNDLGGSSAICTLRDDRSSPRSLSPATSAGREFQASRFWLWRNRGDMGDVWPVGVSSR